jgi:aspartyl-tRNA(Asn)/glutamyl-tRNA(Gln) amidotransferase subunit C
MIAVSTHPLCNTGVDGSRDHPRLVISGQRVTSRIWNNQVVAGFRLPFIMNDLIDIDYVAQLARLELSPNDREIFRKQMDAIVGYCSKIGEVDIADIPPMSHGFGAGENVWREDVAPGGETWSVERALGNAPKVRDNQVVVPKIL